MGSEGVSPLMLCLSRAIAGGRGGINSLAKLGITHEDFESSREAAGVYGYVRDYVSKYSGAPTSQTIMGELGIELPPMPSQPLGYWIDLVRRVRLQRTLRASVARVEQQLERGDTERAYQDWCDAVPEFRALRTHKEAGVVPVMSRSNRQIQLRQYEAMKAGAWGVPMPWPTFDREMRGMQHDDLVMLVARTGVGKCVHKDTIIVDPVTGVPNRIEDVFLDPTLGRVMSWSKEGGIHTRAITQKHDTGTKACLKFVTKTGKEIIVTPEHPFLTPRGWVRADEIHVGETVGSPSQTMHPEEPVSQDAAWIDLSAAILAKGTTRTGGVLYTNENLNLVDVVRKACNALGCDFRTNASRNQYGICKQSLGERNRAIVLLRDCGMMGVLSKNKRLPKFVWRLPAEQLARFLSVFLSHKMGSEVRATSTSEGLVRDLQSALLRFGVQSLVKSSGTIQSWCLTISRVSLEVFEDRVGLLGVAGVGLRALLQAKRVRRNGKSAVRWCAATQALRRHLRAYRGCSGVKGSPDWYWDTGLLWDPVVSIEDAGECKIYDLTVDPTSCFVANDLIVHNTWALLVWAEHARKKGKKVLFVTTELPQFAITARTSAVTLNLPYGKYRKGELEPEDETRFYRWATEHPDDDLDGGGMYMVGGDFNFTMSALEAAIDDLEPDIVFVDGFYLITGGKGRTTQEKMAANYDMFKRMLKRKGIPGVLSTQLNREAAKAKTAGGGAKMEHIAQSDGGGWAASYVFALEQTEDECADGEMKVTCLKHREVKMQKSTMVNWRFDRMDFSEIGVYERDDTSMEGYDENGVLDEDDLDMPF